MPQYVTRQRRPTIQRKMHKQASKSGTTSVNIDINNLTPEGILHLQRTFGNQFTKQLIQRDPKDIDEVGTDDDTTTESNEIEQNNDKDEDPLQEIESELLSQKSEVESTSESILQDDDKGNDKPSPVPIDENELEDNESEDLDNTQESLEDKETPEEGNKNPSLKQRLKPKEKSTFSKIKDGGKQAVKGGVVTYSAVHQSPKNAIELAKIIEKGKVVNETTKETNPNQSYLALAYKAAKGFSDIFKTLAIATLVAGFDIFYMVRQVGQAGENYTAYSRLAGENVTKEDKKKSKDKKGSLTTATQIGAYAMQKVKRAFIGRFTKFAMSVAQLILRLITILSLGSSAVVTEGANLSLSLSKSAMKLFNAGKGIFKYFKGTKGKRRTEASQNLVEGAVRGDKKMLRALVEADIFGSKWMSKMQYSLALRNKDDLKNDPNNKNKVKTSTSNFKWLLRAGGFSFKYTPTEEDAKILEQRPNNEQEVAHYLKLLDRYGILNKVPEVVADSMKST